jgi:hypothetical protein
MKSRITGTDRIAPAARFDGRNWAALNPGLAGAMHDAGYVHTAISRDTEMALRKASVEAQAGALKSDSGRIQSWP